LARERPTVTGTAHSLPFERLSWDRFEALGLSLLAAEGYEEIEHPGVSGGDGGLDLTARRDGVFHGFQCKDVKSFGWTQIQKELTKIHALPEERRPSRYTFIVSVNVPERLRQRARAAAAPMECSFWGLSELSVMVRRHPALLFDFFLDHGQGRPWDIDAFIRSSAEKYANVTAAIDLRLETVSPGSGTASFREDAIPALLDTHRRLLIVGEAGAGKTFLCERIAGRLVSRIASDDSAPLPLVVQLNRYGRPHRGLLELVLNEIWRVGGPAVQPDRVALEQQLAADAVVLIFDGFDSISIADQAEVDTAIADLLRIYSRLRVIVTSRRFLDARAYGFVRAHEFLRLEIAALSDGEIAAYTQTAGISAEELDARTLELLPRTPLMLRMLVQSRMSGHGSVTWAELLDAWVSSLWDTSLRPEVRDLYHESSREVLARIAYELHDREELECPVDRARAAFDDLVTPPASVPALIEDLRGARLLAASHYGFSFAHAEFQRYFAAKWIASSEKLNLHELSANERWDEPYSLAVALMPHDAAKRALRVALARPDLAARCFGELPVEPDFEIREIKERFLRGQERRLWWLSRDWLLAVLMLTACLVTIESILALTQMIRPPAFLYWLSLGGSVLRRLLEESTLAFAAVAVVVPLLVGWSIEELLRLYSGFAVGGFVQPVLEPLVWLRSGDAKQQLDRLKSVVAGGGFVVDGVDSVFEFASYRTHTHATLAAILRAPDDHEASELEYALRALRLHTVAADLDAMAVVMCDARPRVHRAALHVLRSMHGRGIARDRVEALLREPIDHLHYGHRRRILRALARVEDRAVIPPLPNRKDVRQWLAELRRWSTSPEMKEAIGPHRDQLLWLLVWVAIALVIAALRAILLHFK
jgi:hypothetical protein